MPFLDLPPDLRMFYTIDDHTDAWNEAETVVFVHGFCESTEAWQQWVPHFSRKYRVIRYDQRGFGQSGVDNLNQRAILRGNSCRQIHGSSISPLPARPRESAVSKGNQAISA